MSILAKNLNGFLARIAVAPFAGAWIEISWNTHDLGNGGVAPSAGAWIEIMATKSERGEDASLPPRERGLKSTKSQDQASRRRRSLRGSVD